MCSVLAPSAEPENQKKVELDTFSRRRKEISGIRSFSAFFGLSGFGCFLYLSGGQISLFMKTILSPLVLSVLVFPMHSSCSRYPIFILFSVDLPDRSQ